MLGQLKLGSGFPRGSEIKASAWNAGDLGSIPGSGRSPGEGNDNPLQCSCLENPMEGGTWWATMHGVAKRSDTTVQLHFNFHFHFQRNLTPFHPEKTQTLGTEEKTWPQIKPLSLRIRWVWNHGRQNIGPAILWTLTYNEKTFHIYI